MSRGWLLRVGDGQALGGHWKGTGCVPVGIVLPLCLCQQVEVLSDIKYSVC